MPTVSHSHNDSQAHLPKYLRIANQLRRQVTSGDLKPGDRLPSLAEMRAQHGITPTTVERIYSVLRQDGLIVREQGRGTFVADLQKRLATGVIGVSGVTFDLQRHPYWARLMEAIRGAIEMHGRELLLLGETSSIHWEKVDGVLLCGRIGIESLHRLPPGMPHVAALAKVEDAVCILADEEQGVQKGVQHLLELGHRRIGFLVDPLSIHRIRAYRETLQRAGIEAEDLWLRFVDDNPRLHYRGAAFEATQSWLQDNQDNLGVTALIAQNDEVAVGAIEALQRVGITVPHDISVVGFDGTAISEYFSPRLTTVNLPLQEIGVTAVEYLLRQLEGEVVSPATVVLPTRLTAGESTAAVRAS